MLIEPASKVSVPLTVVMRTLSSVPPSAISPQDIADVSARPKNTPCATHVLDVRFEIIMLPFVVVAADMLLPQEKPDVVVAAPTAPLVVIAPVIEEYPDVATEPPPICICKEDVPFVLTPLNITVTRFTQDGIPVKSMLVPDVEATAVPEVIPNTAPLLIVTLAEPLIITAMI